jgi:hypothetical protein
LHAYRGDNRSTQFVDLVEQQFTHERTRFQAVEECWETFAPKCASVGVLAEIFLDSSDHVKYVYPPTLFNSDSPVPSNLYPQNRDTHAHTHTHTHTHETATRQVRPVSTATVRSTSWRPTNR